MALTHLLQPKSSLQIFRLGFLAARTRCCISLPVLKEEAGVEETGSMAVEPFLKESSEKKLTFISHEEPTFTKLADLFRNHKDDQTQTTVDYEGTQPKEKLSDVFLDYSAKYRNSDFEYLSHPNNPLPSEPASDSHDGHSKELFPLNKCENDQSVSYEGGETSSLSNRTHKFRDFKDYMNQAEAELDKPRGLVFSYEPSELSREPHHKQDKEKIPDIKELIDFIKVPKYGQSNSTSSCNNRGLVKKNTLNGNLQKSDDNDSVNSRDFQDGTSKIEDEETSNSEFKSTDFADAKASSKVSFPTRNKDQRQLKGIRFSRKESEENRVLVRFLRSSTPESLILEHFQSCGEILDVEFHDAEGSLFKSAYVYFKTRGGLMKALKKSGSCLSRWTITVESANSRENVKIPIPSLIGNHDIPDALVKNPTRTIKIEQLTREISSYHIEKTLAFCESNVSGYFLGSSHSVAYVEFETETGKERALAKQSINVLGRDLVMLRIDSPRTTVVRIFSDMCSLGMTKILSVCRSLGDVRLCIQRERDLLDVHFGLTEWPKMLEILNRLNGLEIEGTRLQAEPAPVYPPDVLLALWGQPEERKHLKATMQGLLRKLGENKVDTSELFFLQHLFVDTI